jgi:hypothetical protein
VRITAQLIDASADKHLWAKSFERTSRDVLALQDELAAAIAREINVQLTPQEQVRLPRKRYQRFPPSSTPVVMFLWKLDGTSLLGTNFYASVRTEPKGRTQTG